MKPDWANQEVYNYFDAFLNTSILNDNSYITNNPDIFTIANLDSCVAAFVDKPDTGDRDFNEKSKNQFSKNTIEEKIVFSHFIWLWGLPASDMRDWGKKNAVIRFLGDEFSDKLNNVFVDGGIGNAGQRHKLNKPFEISYLLLLFRYVKIKASSEGFRDIDAVKKFIVELCLALYYETYEKINLDDERLKKAGKEFLAMHHILLHLCNPDKYEAIAAQKHKDAIINTFFSLLDKPNTKGLFDNMDDTIFQIRKELSELLGYEISFYDEDIQDAWNFGENKDDISEVTLFEYKKAMIFYGPPGTSKTYSAERLAELLITKQYFRNKQNIKNYFQDSDKIFEKYIHHLQLHSNYSYEDFIAGVQIKNGETKIEQGFLLKLIDQIKDDPMPHILILDEINRTDISRLFGELFSALEYRDKKIKLSVGDLEITLPKNLYFIGTMNEIDFSLERVDFALRRRFLWRFKGFEADLLRKMINQKSTIEHIQIDKNDIENFIQRCERLNNEVSAMPELGENYQIGHTFFAEIVEIFKSFKEIHSGRKHFLSHPVSILWETSIKPIIQAFLGNMDREAKDEKIKDLQKAFING